MGLYVFRFRLGRVVHIAPDVQVVVVRVGNLRFVHQPAVFGNLAFVGEHEVDFLDVLRAQPVLILPFGILPVGVNEQHLVAQIVGLVLVADEHAGRDAGPVKKTLGQTDDGLNHVVVYQQFPNQLLLAPAKEHAVGHDGGHVAVALEAGQHVLDEHQVGLFAGFRAPLAEAVGELHIGAAVVLRERRVGQHPVELA